tara:strand:+ start:94 stop:333 length:240 start_codon:yes stop_codon:yes gene_type:complete
MKKIQTTKLEKLQKQLAEHLDEKVELNCRIFGKMTFTIGSFLDTGIVSKKVLKQCSAWHEDMLVYPTTRALMKMAKGSK